MNANHWLNLLPADSKASWDQMRGLFVEHFQAYIEYLPSANTLANINQIYKNETLKVYLSCFNDEVHGVKKEGEEMLMSLLTTRVRLTTDFLKELQVCEPETLLEFDTRAEPPKQ